MCVDPVSASVMGVALLGGSLMSAVGSIAGGQGQAAIDEQNARNARSAGDQQELTFRDQARSDMATQLAALSTRGIDISTGSPLDLIAKSARNSTLDALAIRSGANRQADVYTMQASAARTSGYMSAASSLLSAPVKLAELGRI